MRRRGGMGAALLAAGLVLPAAAHAADDAPRADPRALAGDPVLALASHPAVTLTLRQASGGRQATLAHHMRLPGPPLRLTPDGRFIYGWACDADRGCGQDGVFLAHDAVAERLFLILVEGGHPNAWVPPRNAPWPAALQAPLRAFEPALAARLRFEREAP